MLRSNATEHALSIATQQCHGRTDGRTDADVLTRRVNLKGRNARRGAAGFGHVEVCLRNRQRQAAPKLTTPTPSVEVTRRARHEESTHG